MSFSYLLIGIQWIIFFFFFTFNFSSWTRADLIILTLLLAGLAAEICITLMAVTKTWWRVLLIVIQNDIKQPVQFPTVFFFFCTLLFESTS